MERERSKFDGTKSAPQAESGAADHRAYEAEARILRLSVQAPEGLLG
jgi:hypothetical protein